MPAFLAPYAAKLAGSLIGWLVILVIIGALFGAWQWERHDRIAAEKGEAAARDQLASATERAQANYDAAEATKLEINACKRAVESQNGEILKWKADSFAMKARNDDLIRAGRLEIERRLADIQAQEEETRAHPEDIHRVSPRVRAFADSLSSE